LNCCDSQDLLNTILDKDEVMGHSLNKKISKNTADGQEQNEPRRPRADIEEENRKFGFDFVPGASQSDRSRSKS
jgi:hypothetical protein